MSAHGQPVRAAAVPVVAAARQHVVILLALHNGEAFIEEQLESLAAQTHEDWILHVSDDGSNDRGAAMVRAFARRFAKDRVRLHDGPRRGSAENFLFLLSQVEPTADYVAFCDQDDVWYENKLARALAAFETIPEGSTGLYCGRTEIADAHLNNRGLSQNFRRPPSFRNAIVQSIAGGNTMVLNRGAIALLQSCAPHASGIIAHDWWAYQVVTAMGGHVLYDATPTVIYRQHNDNLVGANGTLPAQLRRMGKLLRGEFRAWNAANLYALEPLQGRMTPKARQCLVAFQAARNGPCLQRLISLRRSAVYRQSVRGTCSLWLAAFLGRL